MFFHVLNVLCTSYKMRMCSDPSRVVQIPRTSPFAPSPGLKDMHVSFAINPAVRYKKSFILENLPKFTLCSSSIDRALFWAPSTNSCNDFVIFPDDFQSCFKISFDGMCLQINDDNTLVAGKCADISTQSFEFIPLNYGEVPQQKLDAIKMREMSISKKGKLDSKAYEKLRELAKTIQKISKCMTLNGTCLEHATETMPPHCFVHFDLAHYITRDLGKKMDSIHHEEEKEKNLETLQVADTDMKNFENKYKSTYPNQITEPAETDAQKVAADDQANNTRMADNIRAIRNRILGASDEIPPHDLNEKKQTHPEIADLSKDAQKLPLLQALLDTVAEEAKDRLKGIVNPFDIANEIDDKADSSKTNLADKPSAMKGAAQDLFEKTRNKMNEIKESLQKGKEYGKSLLTGIKGLLS